MASAPLAALSNHYSAIQQARAAMERIQSLLAAPVRVTDTAGAVTLPAVRGRVVFRNVTFGYEPGYPVLNDITLTVEPGQVVALIGPSGAGKSTLAHLLLRFYDPQRGRIEVDGHDLAAVLSTLAAARAFPGQPVAIIAYTRKGKGVSFVESDYAYHGKALSPEEADRALEELGWK